MLKLTNLKFASSFRSRRRRPKEGKDVNKKNRNNRKTVIIEEKGKVFAVDHYHQPRIVRENGGIVTEKHLKNKSSSSSSSNSRRGSNKKRFMADAKRPLIILARGLSARILFERNKVNDRNNSSDGWTISSSQDNDEEIQRLLEEASELDQAGNVFFEQGRYQDALKSYTQALKYKDQTLKSENVVNDDDDANNATTDEQQQERETKPPLISTRMKNQLLASVATSINNIGFIRQKLGDTTAEDIMSAYQDSLRIKKKILGENDLSIGTTLNNIGSVYFKDGNYELAMESYQRALEIMVSNLGMYHLDVATVHSNIGDVYAAMMPNKLDAARISYDAALQVRWSELGVADPCTTRLLERIAAIDMAETERNLIERPRKTSEDYCPPSDTPTTLADDIYDNVVSMEEFERDLELEMFRDKIEMICEMREL